MVTDPLSVEEREIMKKSYTERLPRESGTLSFEFPERLGKIDNFEYNGNGNKDYFRTRE